MCAYIYHVNYKGRGYHKWVIADFLAIVGVFLLVFKRTLSLMLGKGNGWDINYPRILQIYLCKEISTVVMHFICSSNTESFEL